jgi:hypothetical protein
MRKDDARKLDHLTLEARAARVGKMAKAPKRPRE